jgi:GNAT superfamily N-acetyltransferase
VGDSRLVEASIRSYRESDAPDVVRLSLRAWAPVHTSLKEVMGDEIFHRLYGDDWRHQQQEDVEQVLIDEASEVWVAEVGGNVVGFAAAILKPWGAMGEIHLVAVEPDFQNKGLGTRLTDTATNWMQEQGCSLALISTGGDLGHAPARRTYEKAGYTAVPFANYFKPL